MTHSQDTVMSWMWTHVRPVLVRLPRGSHPPPPAPPPRQEELEFAVMRIEALKLARQIALASRGRQDAKVPTGLRRAAPPPGNGVWSGRCSANPQPGWRGWCSTLSNSANS